MLTSLGVGVSDFTDVLIDDSCAREAAEYLAAELCRIGRWRVIDLPEVPDSSATAHLVDVARPLVGSVRIGLSGASGALDSGADRGPAE